MTASTRPESRAHPARHSLSHRWPTLLGLAGAAVIILTGDGADGPATALLVAVVCYLAAAATNRPWVAWAAVPAGSVVVVAGRLLGVASWVSLGIAAAALLLTGLAMAASRAALTAQTAALLAYGGLATVALFLPPAAGLVLVGATLTLHAVWDVVHLRRGVVVPGSLAEFCIFLDVPVGLTAIVVAVVAV